MKVIVLLIALFSVNLIKAQDNPHEIALESEIYNFPDVDPAFPVGKDSIRVYFENNLKYPQTDFLDDYNSTVYISFIVEQDGSVSNLKIEKGEIENLNKEAKAAVKSMPKWIPAKMNGKIVRSRVLIPIKFTLD